MNYECHITIPRDSADIGETIATELHWKFSKIDGDPVLGKKVFAYLTTHDSDLLRMRERMQTAADALRARGIDVVREKIELIVYDVKHNF